MYENLALFFPRATFFQASGFDPLMVDGISAEGLINILLPNATATEEGANIPPIKKARVIKTFFFINFFS